ncbi:MAG: hypothetical protein AAF222_09305 [Pseudomonadota bacterium]
MLGLSPDRLAKRSAAFRYGYYLVTSCKLKSFRGWKCAGEPNPFVEKTYRHKVTERVEFTDIFDDVLGPDRRHSRNSF